MGSRNLSGSFSFAKDILRNATNKLNEFVDSALSTYEESTGRRLRHGDEGIRLAGGSDFCMDIRRYDMVSPAGEEVVAVSEAEGPVIIPEQDHLQHIEESPAIEPVVIGESVAADDIAVEEPPVIRYGTVEEVPKVEEVPEPIVVEEPFSEVEYVDADAVAYGSPSGETGFDEDRALMIVPSAVETAKTSTAVEVMPAFHLGFEEIDDGVDYEDLYEDLVAETIVYDIMPGFMAGERYVPEYVISDIASPTEASTVIDVPETYVPEYVISEIGSPVEESTVIDVPVTYVPEYVISDIDEPVTGSTTIDVPLPVAEVPSVSDPVTTTATFRFAFASTSTPGRTGFTFRMGKRDKVDEFINGPSN